MKKLFHLFVPVFTALCFFTAGSASAQGSFFTGNAYRYTPAGVFAASGASVTVCTSSGAGAPCTPTISIFKDAALLNAVANPLPVCGLPAPQFGCIDGLGNFSFYASTPGPYTYTITGAGLSAYGPIPIYSSLSLAAANTFTALQTFSAGITGTGSIGTLTAPYGNLTGFPSACGANQFATQIAATPGCTQPAFSNLSGIATPTQGGTGANLSATGGAGQYVKQTSVGGNFSVGTIPGADVPATTSNCSGVQFAQGLNAGHTPVCATPPTFVASGGSHAVGYVPDPGSSAGTTRFLREDATWIAAPGGVSEATWAVTWPPFVVNGGGTFSAVGLAATAVNTIGAETIFAQAHTLVRFTAYLPFTLSGCTTAPVVAFYDETSAAAVQSITIPNGTSLVDSGAVSVSMTAGHTFSIRVTTAANGCGSGNGRRFTNRRQSGFRNRRRNAVRVVLKAGKLSQRFLRFGKDLFLKTRRLDG